MFHYLILACLIKIDGTSELFGVDKMSKKLGCELNTESLVSGRPPNQNTCY